MATDVKPIRSEATMKPRSKQYPFCGALLPERPMATGLMCSPR